MSRSSSSRFGFVDALRGIAASGVLLHHLSVVSMMMLEAYRATSPLWLRHLFGLGSQGVTLFFVLSGFVIAHSLRHDSLSLQSLARFILRRQVRLDPPYWATLALPLGLIWAHNHHRGSGSHSFLSPRDALLNATYLQILFRLPPQSKISAVAWTLCLELQFYLLFIAVLWLTGRGGNPSHSRQNTLLAPEAAPVAPEAAPIAPEAAPVAPATLALLWASGAACLVVRLFVVDAAWFWAGWHYFVAGVLVYWAVMRRASDWWIASLLVLFVLSLCATAWTHPVVHYPSMNSTSWVGLIVGGCTTLALWRLGLTGRLDSWSRVRPLQFLGRVSYSLYLTHLFVLEIVLRLAGGLIHNNPFATGGAMIAASAACLVVAYGFHLVVERPSLRWANALRSSRQGESGHSPVQHTLGSAVPPISEA